jgi:HAD superfamily hydrolase (TIGR01490 family)
MDHTLTRENNSTGNYTAFFDLDGTIISINSGRTLVRHAYKQGLMTRLDLLKGIYLSLLYRYNLMNASKIVDSMVGWVSGVSEALLYKASAEIFQTYILNSIRQTVKSEISFHKTNGGSVIILSSSIRPVCQLVSDHFEMDGIICSDLEVKDGNYTGLPSGPLCFGEEKTVRLLEYCRDRNVAPINAWYYGDSISDLHVLNSVGHPVCVSPDKKLKKTALQKGWKIIY